MSKKYIPKTNCLFECCLVNKILNKNGIDNITIAFYTQYLSYSFYSFEPLYKFMDINENKSPYDGFFYIIYHDDPEILQKTIKKLLLNILASSYFTLSPIHSILEGFTKTLVLLCTKNDTIEEPVILFCFYNHINDKTDSLTIVSNSETFKLRKYDKRTYKHIESILHPDKIYIPLFLSNVNKEYKNMCIYRIKLNKVFNSIIIIERIFSNK